jgi:hypothetical protein
VALVGARLPPVELQRQPESVVHPPLRPTEARGVGATLLRLLLGPPPRPIEELSDMVVASAGRICARCGLCVRPATSNCGGRGKFERGLWRGEDQFTTRIDPLDRYKSRSMRAGCGRMHHRWGPTGRYCVCSVQKKGLGSTNRLGRRDAGRFAVSAVSARVALRACLTAPVKGPKPQNNCQLWVVAKKMSSIRTLKRQKQ